KLTVFVDNQPAYKVMGGISRLYGLVWRIRGEGFEIRLPENPARAQARARKATLAKMQVVVDETVAIASQSDEEVARQKVILEKQIADLLRSGPHKDLSLLNFQIFSLEPDVLPYVRFYGSMPKAAQNAVWTGNDVWFSTASPEPKWAIRRPFKPIDNARTNDPSASFDVGFALAGARMRPMMRGILATNGNRNGSYILSLAHWIKPDDDLPLLPQQLDMPELQKKIKLLPEELLVEANLPDINKPNQPATINRSDLLSLVHEKSGLQIISDHVTYFFKGGFLSEGTPLDMVKASENFPWDYRLEWGGDGTFAYIRSKRPLQTQSGETPSRTIAFLKQSADSNAVLSEPVQQTILHLSQDQRVRLSQQASSLGLQLYGAALTGFYIAPKSITDFVLSLSPAHFTTAKQGWLPISRLTDAEIEKMPDEHLRGSKEVPQPYKIGLWKDGIRVDGPMVNQPEITPVAEAFRVEILTSDQYTCAARNQQADTGAKGRQMKVIQAASLRELENVAKESGATIEMSTITLARTLNWRVHWAMSDGQESLQEQSIKLVVPLPPNEADSAGIQDR
ncbi:MAG: hypothetical protein WCL39_15395, partial [Armatimonadota bacterium]